LLKPCVVMENTLSRPNEMTEKLHLFICEHFKAETAAVISAGAFPDVALSYFPARCSRPVMTNKRLSALPMFKRPSDDDNVVCGCSCMSTSDKEFLDERDILYLDHVTCFEMFAPPDLVNQLMTQGAYIITPGWLADWRSWAAQWGTEDQARQIFSETITKLVLLDTGTNSDWEAQLAEFSAYIDRPWESLPVGIDYYRYFLENKILNWRLSKKDIMPDIGHTNNGGGDSDYAMALDLLIHLPRTEEEEIVANRIMEIFSMMFAAQKIHYLSIVDSKPQTLWSAPADLDSTGVAERLSTCVQNIKPIESGAGFCLRITAGNNPLAIIEVDDLLMPENLARYQNLALAMLGVFALSIENSRYFHSMKSMNVSLQELNATKDKFFSIIAHDLKNPFATVIGFSDVLLERVKENNYEGAGEIAEIIKNSSERAMALLMNLMEWSRSQTGRMEYNPRQMQVSSLIEDLWELLNDTAKQKSILLLKEIPSGKTIFADSAMISTVIRNLISNALKFTNPGGKIVLSAEKKATEWHITVADNGVGIPAATIPKIFLIDGNISTTGTQNEQGTGLGLVLCKEFIEKHGGHLWVESEIDKGSSFYFTIPDMQITTS
jgi:two-component system, sensor histidine kinase and response regulator